MHLTPACFPSGIPGIGEEIESAIQQAPHFERHFILKDKRQKTKDKSKKTKVKRQK